MATKTFLFAISTTGHCFTVFLHSFFTSSTEIKSGYFVDFGLFYLLVSFFLSSYCCVFLCVSYFFTRLSSHISAELAYSLTHWLKGPCWIFNEDCDTWTDSDSHSCVHESSSLQHVLTSFKYCYKDDFYESLHVVCVLNHCHHTRGFCSLDLAVNYSS